MNKINVIMGKYKLDDKPKRICCRPGNVFCVEVKGLHKRYFQYLGRDYEYLGAKLVRVFKKRYPMEYEPIIEEIISGEVDFYRYTYGSLGASQKYWYRVGTSRELGDLSNIYFITANCDSQKTNYCIDWSLVKAFTLGFIFVGKLPVKYQTCEMGAVTPLEFLYWHICKGYAFGHNYPKFFKEQEKPSLFSEGKEIEFLESLSRPDLRMVNGWLDEWLGQDKFKYCLKVITKLEEMKENKQPTDNELEILNKFERILDYGVKGPNLDSPNGEYLGRIISNGEMLSIWIIDSPEKVKSYIIGYTWSDRYLRHFDYRITRR